MTSQDSAHRSSDPAHRSGTAELKTEVWLIKTPDDHDAVIVSFVDDGEVNGIYLYEPGADPVELSTVGLSVMATEFEHAEVTFSDTYGVEEFTMPGDGMVTRAERDAAVEQATEDHDNLEQAYGALREQAQDLVDAVTKIHDEGHSGAFQWCDFPVCEAAKGVEL